MPDLIKYNPKWEYSHDLAHVEASLNLILQSRSLSNTDRVKIVFELTRRYLWMCMDVSDLEFIDKIRQGEEIAQK